jgi:hypothetical protein
MLREDWVLLDSEEILACGRGLSAQSYWGHLLCPSGDAYIRKQDGSE